MADQEKSELQISEAHPVRYPKRNRPTNNLTWKDIHIVQQDEVHQLEPNSAAMFILNGASGMRAPIEGCVSDISGEPAYIYRTDEIELRLTRGELARLVTRNLQPGEFKILAEKYGIFHEIHSDFYDEVTGFRLQGY